MMLILMLGLYRKYNAKNSMMLLFITLFIPSARFLIVFILRNNTAIDYEEYMRARREAYIRQQQQYYGNGYGSPYNRPYNNPYANPYNRPQQPPQPQPEEPFAEFGGKKEESPFSEFDDTKERNPNDPDEFFN